MTGADVTLFLLAVTVGSLLAGLVLFLADYSLARVWMEDVEVAPIAAKAALHGAGLGVGAGVVTVLILAATA